MSRQKTERWYCYRRKRDNMEIRRNRWSPWLLLRGYRLIDVVVLETKEVRGA